MVSDSVLRRINRLFMKNRRPVEEKRFGRSVEKRILYEMAAFLCLELTEKQRFTVVLSVSDKTNQGKVCMANAWSA